MGWSATAQSLDIIDVPGTHTNLSPDDAREVCDQLRARRALGDIFGVPPAQAAKARDADAQAAFWVDWSGHC